MKNVVIGTAGHIDHGKTTLIKALTGRETDTLAEEKKRGISINLGFTYFDLPSGKRAGIVDVPGHEKFIKNMLAGVAGIDIVLFVIAADEGVMPQTVEHLDILNFLDVKKGLIVLTKCDKADKDLLEIVKEDIKETVKDTFLEDSETIEIDSISNRGLDNLVKKIDALVKDIEDISINISPRINIDRVFSVNGFGTVITGTLLEGTINIDEDLVIYPSKIEAKIRNIQVHGNSVNTAYAGQRVAINIANVKVEDIKRGDILAKRDSLEESMMIDVRVSLVNHSNKILKHWDRLRLYHGSREILCRIVPLDTENIKTGKNYYAQLRLEEGLVSKRGDKFVLRNYSPLETIGGGIIIDASPKKHKRFDNKVIESLKIKESGDLKDIIESYIKEDIKRYIEIKDINISIGIDIDEIAKNVELLESENKVIIINNIILHITKYEKLKEKCIEILSKYHKSYRLRDGIIKEELRSKLDKTLKIKDIDKLLDMFLKDEIVKLNGNTVSLYNFDVKLNEKQLNIRDEIQNTLKKSNMDEVRTIEEICNNNSYYIEVLDFMVGKTVEKLDEVHIMDKEYFENLKKDLIDYLKVNKEISLGEYRDLIKSSRKNCLIILESFDRKKITKRYENKRTLA